MTSSRIRHLIGAGRVGVPERVRTNPADPSEVVSLAPNGTADDIDRAARAARDASVAWSATPAPRRGDILNQAAGILTKREDSVARDLVAEEGKTLAEALGEVRRTCDILRYHGSAGWWVRGETFSPSQENEFIYTDRQPLGVVGLITPWNFPIAIPAWKLAPALVAGNTVVLKPSEFTPTSADNLATALLDAGLPPGVLNVVHGDGVAGAALAGNVEVDAVSFTGSVSSGALVRQACESRGARVQVEMGGKNALVVAADADLPLAARIAALGGFGLTGQACTATSRVIVEAAVHDHFVDELVQLATRYRPGNGLDDGILMGPVVSEQKLKADLRLMRQAVEEGGDFATGAPRASGLALDPVVVVGVGPEHRIARDEAFAPIIAVLPSVDFEESVSLVNDSDYGLAAGIVTRRLSVAQEFAKRANAGVVKINRPTTGLELSVPFGGIKASSNNAFREQGPRASDFFTWEKTVYVGWEHRAVD